MITDLVVSAVTDFLKASGRSELSSVTFFERDFGGDLTYPACIVSEDGTIRKRLGDNDETVIIPEPGETIQTNFVRCIQDGLTINTKDYREKLKQAALTQKQHWNYTN